MTDEQDTPYEPRDNEIFGSWEDRDGVVHDFCNKEIALAKLLIDDVVFVNTRVYVDIDYDQETKKWGYDYERYKDENYDEKQYTTTVLFVNCNDVFAWGCADSEPITDEEIPNLYRFHAADNKWGSLKWVCQKRNLQPQMPIIRDMKLEGVWDDMMENLPEQNNKRK